MKIRILQSAKQDLIHGYRFYEEQQEQLGQYFLNCLYSDIDSLLLYAGIHRRRYGLYCLLSKRFPYAIYYAVEGKLIQVHAVLDCRQDPRSTEGRLLGN